ncbi:MAG: UDP-N-acetylmuramoyl-L-alanine--D-glutamate ligase [Lachnospiraceae bacterium]|nr:UDP-N-acetylmuramoyl-L-alanine--D-glutamate ligase [Lachnospiraceae bacterium]
MLTYLHERLLDRTVLILGFGREGKSSLHNIIKAGGYKTIAIADMNDVSLDEETLEICKEVNININDILFQTGPAYQDAIDSYDLVMKSPGIVLEKERASYKAEIVSQMQLTFERFRDRIIGITGTKGKSTTTTLLYHILKEAGRDVLLAGNIGIPVFDVLDRMKDETLLVLELSCHQLEYMTVSPKWGMLLNIYEEHLDHYGTMEKYVASKLQIYLHQKAGDRLYLSPQVTPYLSDCHTDCIYISADVSNGEVDINAKLTGRTISYNGRAYEIPVDEIRLIGSHNYIDIAFDYALCADLGMDDATFEAGLKSYEPLPHRLQKFAVIDGVEYYDDSISTIDETTIRALETVKNAATVLIGGMDRGISYVNLEEFLSTSSVKNIILMEETGRRIAKEISENYPDFPNKERLLVTEHLEDAVALAKKVTKPGEAVILSPAAASYGIFKNFEHRGEVFKELVTKEK